MLKEMFTMENNLNPVEKIISEKFGKTGLEVYALIDGNRTTKEIMKETGVKENKLANIVDFMHYQGIVKVDYPKTALS
jgi:hypothetical protein